MNRPFDPLELPLAGVQLIEASAGTGKTYSIASLYLRLLLEKRLAVDKILVVTFTEAATAELHERLRRRLAEAVEAFRSGNAPADDSFLAALLAQSRDRPVDLLLLQKALAEIDQAAVATIHGFCQKMLRQGAFESGIPFALELLTDLLPLQEEVLADYLAGIAHRDDSRLLALLQDQQQIRRLRGMVRAGLQHRDFPLAVGAEIEAAEIAVLLPEAERAFTAAARCWREESAAILADCSRARLVKNLQDRLDADLGRELAAYLEAPRPPSFVAPAGSEKLTPEAFNDPDGKACTPTGIKTGQVPGHPFFQLWQQYLTSLARLTTAWRLIVVRDLIAFARHEVPRRLAAARTQSFDDLLYGLKQALEREGGAELARLIAGRYPVALIDEFQDTDPVQYAIFQQIYGSRPDAALFLIGDPKQAIYGFRGADIYAYLKAARSSGGRHTMNVNWRADREMVAAINRLFAGSGSFYEQEIEYHRVTARPEAVGGWQPGAGMAGEAFQFLLADAGERASKTSLEKVIPDLVATDIARLLAGGGKVRGEAARPGDIAVLVRTNLQAAAMQRALRNQGIKAVLYSSASVFEGPEARDIFCLLHGLAGRGGEAGCKAALATDLLGITAEELMRLSGDQAAWQRKLADFSRWQTRWRERGFMAMIRTIIEEEGVAARLLSLDNGERRLTNFRHLLELLHSAERDGHRRPPALLKWLGERISGSESGGEEAELRLESDEQAVRVVTIHHSKGLEYPLVYCPYAWQGSGPEKIAKEELFSYHDPQAEWSGRLALFPDAGQRQRRFAESFAEELRLLYVALTRAKHCCMVVWAGVKEYRYSALAWLLHRPESPDALASFSHRELVDLFRQRLAEVPEWGMREIGGCLDEKWQIGVAREATTVAAGECRRPERSFDARWRVGSFSQLIAQGEGESGEDKGAMGESALPVRAKGGQVPADWAATVPLAAFPAGTGPGNAIHRIFETIAFDEPGRHSEQIVAALRGAGLSPEQWLEPVQQGLRHVLQTPLGTGTDAFCLAEISQAQRLTEMPFILPVRQEREAMTPAELAAIFAQYPEGMPEAYAARLARLAFPALQGFLKGFVDLVLVREGRWYIVDYKSNLLGGCYQDYRPEQLAAVMAEHHYLLQYHLYSVALHRWLAARLAGYDYHSHFGGVFYLFIRGMSPELGPAAGIFHERPPQARIEALSTLFA